MSRVQLVLILTLLFSTQETYSASGSSGADEDVSRGGAAETHAARDIRRK